MTTTNKDVIEGKAYTRKEVAKMLHVGTATIDNYIKSKKLKAVKIGAKKVLITESYINEFLESQTKIK